MAAYYPAHPTPAQQEEMRSFMLSLARVYPCGYCADRTEEEMRVNPPRVQSQEHFAQWMCEIHNEVKQTGISHAPQVVLGLFGRQERLLVALLCRIFHLVLELFP